MSGSEAIRAVVRGRVQGVGFREATLRRARELGVMGWVRNLPEGDVQIHAEGDPAAVESLLDFLRRGPALALVATVDADPVAVEGHEQFAVRGVMAGAFLIDQQRAGFDLRLQVGHTMRTWTLPKGPSLDPAVKRLAVEAGTRELALGQEGPEAIVWDRGGYEQGGRVAWPEALGRGHAVFVLHGEKLRGGFALQRTRAQWLLIKRRDDWARPGSDVVAEQPQSVLSGRTLQPD
ncbi:MAG TPA: acylphosphatase [Solirubrobacteraceae bacterium]|nr:acylphosphatase [Solirubrobacteraceae bacterium]